MNAKPSGAHMDIAKVSDLIPIPEPLRSMVRVRGERAYATALEKVQEALHVAGIVTDLPRWKCPKVFRADLPLVSDSQLVALSRETRVATSYVYHAGGPLPEAIAARVPPLTLGASLWVEDPRTGALYAFRVDTPDPALAALVPGEAPTGLSPHLASALVHAGILVDPIAEEAKRRAFAAHVEEAQRAFRRDGFVVLKGVLPPGVLAGLSAYCQKLPLETRLHQDPYSGRLVERNEPAARFLQASLRGFVSRFLDREVASTFSYSMWYFEGARLALHRDTPFCEYTLNFVVAQDPPDPARWPLNVVGRDGRIVEVKLEVGDAILFRGHELEHYRGRLEGARGAIGVMCHYVDRAFPGLMVHFPTDKATLPPTAREAIDHWTQVLRDHPEIRKLELAGHNDGSERDTALAQRRAEQVKAALVARGADPARLVTVSHGSNMPVGDNAQKRGRAENRRVVLTVRERSLAP